MEIFTVCFYHIMFLMWFHDVYWLRYYCGKSNCHARKIKTLSIYVAVYEGGSVLRHNKWQKRTRMHALAGAVLSSDVTAVKRSWRLNRGTGGWVRDRGSNDQPSWEREREKYLEGLCLRVCLKGICVWSIKGPLSLEKKGLISMCTRRHECTVLHRRWMLTEFSDQPLRDSTVGLYFFVPFIGQRSQFSEMPLLHWSNDRISRGYMDYQSQINTRSIENQIEADRESSSRLTEYYIQTINRSEQQLIDWGSIEGSI